MKAPFGDGKLLSLWQGNSQITYYASYWICM